MELVGLIAGALELLGLWLLGNKQRLGFLVSLSGNILWITFVLVSKQSWGLLLVCPVALILNLRGWKKWGGSSAGRAPH